MYEIGKTMAIVNRSDKGDMTLFAGKLKLPVFLLKADLFLIRKKEF